MEKECRSIVRQIKTYFSQAKFSKAVVGVSGGVDSAVCCTLAVRALGKENVTAILMPEKGLTKRENVEDGVKLAKKLGVKYYVVPINPFLKQYEKLPWKANKHAYINKKARVRATILYHFANTFDALVVGTGNKTEALLGYGTKYGDLACDIFFIGDLYKTDVWKLAEYLGVDERIRKKTPTAELFHGQTDEGELGYPYAEMDAMLKKKDARLMRRVKANAHKMKFPYVVKA